MRGPYTSNGLELLYTGEFAVDFAAHTVIDLAARFNSNMLTLDEALAILAALKRKMDILEFKGHVVGILNGGVSGIQPTDLEVLRANTRLIHNRLSDEDSVPSLAVPVVAEDAGLFKNELSVNSYGGGDLVGQSPGLWLRVGTAETANVNDKLLRIGKALVTDDIETILEPTVTFDDTNVVWTGELWLRNSDTDKAFFVHDGESFFRVTPVEATELVSGIVKHASDEQVLAGVSETTVISPADLTLWKEDLELVSRTRFSTRLYVDSSLGDDSLSNDGKDPRYPYLTINRALLEVARQSFVAGFNNDTTGSFTIVWHPGEYLIDNRPGSSNYALLTRQTLDDDGPINKVVLASNVTNVALNSLGQTVLTVDGAITAGLTTGVNIWSADATKQGIVTSFDNSRITITRVKGAWDVGDQVTFADYSVFNSPDGGVIVPRGTSIIGVDLRKNVVRPRFLGNLTEWIAAISGTDCICSPVGNTNIFLLTGDSYVANLTFADNSALTETHHLCAAFNFAKATDLTDANYGYYAKIFQVLGNTVFPPITLNEFQAGALEINIVSSALTNLVTDSGGFRLIDTVKGASPYVSNCSLRSRFGMRGIIADGSRVGGFKSIVAERFTIISMQSDGRAFDNVEAAPGGKAYKEQWRHVAIEAVNDAYIQAVSCFTIAPAVHYRVREGGEISLANCFVNFGDIAFDAIGHSITSYPQDQNVATIQLVPPKPITSDTQKLTLGSFKYDVSSSNRLYVYDDELTEERINPFSLQPGETLYLKTPLNVEYTAELVDSTPFFEQDANGWYIKVKGLTNNIYNSGGESVDSFFIDIERTPDTRAPADKIYWLEVNGLEAPEKRSPQRNYIVSFNSIGSPNYALETPLWIAAVRDRDSSGNPFGVGIYQIALMAAAGTNDVIADLYPPLNLDRPQVNPATSKTYQATSTFLSAIGMSTNSILDTLVEGVGPRLLLNSNGEPQDVYLDFLKPSTIRSFGTGLEWVGYGNYNSALPKYQDYEFNITDLFAKIKRERNAGRVHNIGMTDDGKFIVGNTVVDLTGGEETNIEFPFEDSSKVYKNVTITNRLFMYPSSRLRFSGATISLDATTVFNPTINDSYAVYANQTKAGFTRFATQNEANALTISSAAIAPATLPLASETQKGLIEIASSDEANALSLNTVAITPGNLPKASVSQAGVLKLATEAEANALTLETVAVSPGTLPTASLTQQGLVELATVDESKALTDNTKAITPATQPIASREQLGLSRFATTEEVDDFSTIAATLRPSDIKRLYRLLQKDQIGVCKFFAGDSPPDGHLLCLGQAISRATYADLFGVIGTTWGDGNGVDTFNLPPAEKVFIAAGFNSAYVHGQIGGAESNIVTSSTVLNHTHTNSVSLDGGFTPTGNTGLGGQHTPQITVLESGAHTHVINVEPGGGQPITGTVLANAPVIPTVNTVSEEGSHTHTVVLDPSGAHTHTGTTALAGGYTPQITVVPDGGHGHTAQTWDWGPANITGLNTLLSGGHGHAGSYTNEKGGHTHGGVANLDGGHDHAIIANGNAGNTGYAPDGTGESTSYVSGHTHNLNINENGGHYHDVTVATVNDHFHAIPTFEIPRHNHGINIDYFNDHSHDLVVVAVDPHAHTFTTSEVVNHNHVVSSVSEVLDHTHTITINQIDGHVHTLQMTPLPNHPHTATSQPTAHSHTLNISVVPAHDHTLTLNAVEDHRHTVTINDAGSHNHTSTVSTIQPYAAMNVIIYTGVYAD